MLEASRSLRADDLARNGLGPGDAQAEALYTLIYAGKAKMPGYGELCAPRGQCTFGARLSEAQIRELAAFVAAQAAAGWRAATATAP